MFAPPRLNEVLGDAIPFSFDTLLVLSLLDPDSIKTASKALQNAFISILNEPLITSKDQDKKQFQESGNEGAGFESQKLDSSKNLPLIPESFISDSLYGHWKEVKTRGVISLYKKQIQQGSEPAELHRAVITIKCDAARIVGVLSNPRHFQHMYPDTFSDCKVIHQGT